jgi:hypothetical protein
MSKRDDFIKVRDFVNSNNIGKMVVMWPCVGYSVTIDGEQWELAVLDVQKTLFNVRDFFTVKKNEAPQSLLEAFKPILDFIETL